MARSKDDLSDQEKSDLARARDMIVDVQAAVETIFSGPQGKLVLEWLALITGVNRSMFHANDRVHAYREGKRSVFLELNQFLHMTPEQIFRLRERKFLR